MDSYYLNNAVEKLNEFLVKADNPKFTGEIVFERRAPHCWGPRGAELMTKMIAHIEKDAPAGSRSEELEVLAGSGLRAQEDRRGAVERGLSLEAEPKSFRRTGSASRQARAPGDCRGATGRGWDSGRCLRRSSRGRPARSETNRLTDRFMRRKREAGIAIARASTLSTIDSCKPTASSSWLKTRTRSVLGVIERLGRNRPRDYPACAQPSRP